MSAIKYSSVVCDRIQRRKLVLCQTTYTRQTLGIAGVESNSVEDY
jgi:hypothetical protein